MNKFSESHESDGTDVIHERKPEKKKKKEHKTPDERNSLGHSISIELNVQRETKEKMDDKEKARPIRYQLQTKIICVKIQFAPFNHGEECMCFRKHSQAHSDNKRRELLSCRELDDLPSIEQSCFCHTRLKNYCTRRCASFLTQ